ncbi:MAG TPA: response regulator transcription factor [Kineosporiaceae bacterium]
MTIRVLLADDQGMVRAGFRMILQLQPDVEVVGEAGDGAEAVRLAVSERPDVVLMDVQMPGTDGLSATREVVSRTSASVLILTTFDRDDYLFESLQAGASGFLLKNASPEDLVDAVRVVARGDALLAPEVTRRVLEAAAGRRSVPRPPDPSAAAALGTLTERELEVFRLVARGLSNAEVGARLFLAEATVKTHVSRVLAKLALRDRVQAVVHAYRTGVVAPGD